MINWIVDHMYALVGVIMLLILMLLIALYNAPELYFDDMDDDEVQP